VLKSCYGFKQQCKYKDGLSKFFGSKNGLSQWYGAKDKWYKSILPMIKLNDGPNQSFRYKDALSGKSRAIPKYKYAW